MYDAPYDGLNPAHISELAGGSKFPAVPPPKLELPWKKYFWDPCLKGYQLCELRLI